MENAVLSLIIFLICILLFVWDKLPMATTAILGCTAMVISGVCDFKTAFGQFASSTVILTAGIMIIGAAVSESGLAAMIGRWIIRSSRGSERRLIAGTYLTATVMSAFLTNSAVLAIFIPIILGISRSSENNKAKRLIMPITYGCVLGGASTLVGSTQQMTAQGLLEESGLKMFKTFDFTLVVGVIIVFGLVYCLTIGYYVGEKLWGSGFDEELDFQGLRAGGENDKGKMITVAVIFLATVVLYITEWFPLPVTSTAAAILCIITNCISQKKAIESVDWNIVGRLAACLGLAKALESAGGTAILTEGFKALIGNNISPFLLFCLFVLLVLIVSNFISNSTAILIVLPIIIALAPNLEINTYAFALGITISAGIPLCCPLASSTLGMSMAVGYKFNDYFKYSIIFEAVSYLIIITLIPLIYGLTL